MNQLGNIPITQTLLVQPGLGKSGSHNGGGLEISCPQLTARSRLNHRGMFQLCGVNPKGGQATLARVSQLTLYTVKVT